MTAIFIKELSSSKFSLQINVQIIFLKRFPKKT